MIINDNSYIVTDILCKLLLRLQISEVQRRTKSCDRDTLSMSLSVSRCPLRDRTVSKKPMS